MFKTFIERVEQAKAADPTRILEYPIKADMQIEDLAIQTHLSNMVNTYGEAKVLSFVKFFFKAKLDKAG